MKFSRLMLGTAQLGLQYGIANKNGQPSYQDARDLLACAAELGINGLDTAAIYGNSEAVIGKALAELGLKDYFTVVTKVKALNDETLAGRSVRAAVEGSVGNSMALLGLDPLPMCLLHREEDFVHWDELVRLQEKGWVQHIGISTGTPEGTEKIVGLVGLEAVQIPTNILDQRFTDVTLPQRIAAGGGALFVRSVFLQGLLLMQEEMVPEELEVVIPVRRRLAEVGDKIGLSLEELAARYALSLPGLTSVVVGVDSPAQLKRNAELFSGEGLEAATLAEVQQIARGLPEQVLCPWMWRNVRNPWKANKPR